MNKNEKDVITKFVDYLSLTRGIHLKITLFPDESNRITSDIDAIAEGNGVSIAIEHTTIDSVDKQREDSG